MVARESEKGEQLPCALTLLNQRDCNGTCDLDLAQEDQYTKSDRRRSETFERVTHVNELAMLDSPVDHSIGFGWTKKSFPRLGDLLFAILFFRFGAAQFTVPDAQNHNFGGCVA